MRRVIGTVEGVDILEHDGVTEWADCAECGAHLDPASDASTPGREWDGSCYLCGAASERVGMRRECAICAAGGIKSIGTVEIPHDPVRDGLPVRVVYACEECVAQMPTVGE